MSLLWIVRSQHLLLLLIVQLITSLWLIYYGKNKLSYVTEIVLVIGTICYNRPNFEIATVLYYVAEYVLMKGLLLLIVWLAKQFSFYVMMVITHPKKKLHKFFITKRRFLKIQARIWNKVKYGIRVKKGLPSMVGKKNASTGIYFDKDGFPKFKEFARVKLDKKYWKKIKTVHFYWASRMLYEKIKKNSRLAKKFTKKEISEFKKGNLPDKYTWHHHQDKGVLQLVDRKIHAEVRHNGGFSIWGRDVK